MSDLDDSLTTTTSLIITNLVQDLFSHDPIKTRQVVQYYFLQNATLTSPVLKIKGISNIQHVYNVWQIFHRKKPTINTIVVDRNVAVVHFTDHVSPRVLPSCLSLDIPSITTLYFKETDGGILKIWKQVDNWTVEGLLQSVPIVSFWYNHIIRFTLGKMLTVTGDLLDAAYMQADKLTVHGQELQRIGLDMAMDNLDRLDTYRSELQHSYMRARQHY